MKIKVLFCCAAAMSTGVLGNKMAIAAKKRGMDAEFDVVTASGIYKIDFGKKHYDAIILGPQVRHTLKDVRQNIGRKYGIPVDSIPFRAYGLQDGEAVLEQVLGLMKRSSRNVG